jgi:hypothetical protein
VIFERDGCYLCHHLESEIHPKLVAEFGAALEIERRDALEGMQSPTLLILGKDSKVVSGLPEYQELQKAILAIRGQ